MASEWIASGISVPANYPGSTFSDGGTGLTLCTLFQVLTTGWITKLRFWKVPEDTVTSRTIGLYDTATHTLVTSVVTSGEPVGTGQWIEVPLTTPLAVTGHPVLTSTGFYVAVQYEQQKYAATAGANPFGAYSTGGNAYTPNSGEAVSIGGIVGGSGAYKYSTGINYPDAGGVAYFWVDAFWTDVDPAPPTSLPESFQSDAFQADAFEANVLAQFALTEGPDVASFNVTSTTQLSFNISEGPDLAAFAVIARTYVLFDVLEGPDVAAFNVTSTTQLSFNISEGPDIPSFNVLTGARLSFNLVEGPDIASFRTWRGDFTLGDADYIVVPYENKMALVPFDNTQTELMPSDDITSLPDEWQRVDVDQTRGRRKK